MPASEMLGDLPLAVLLLGGDNSPDLSFEEGDNAGGPGAWTVAAVATARDVAGYLWPTTAFGAVGRESFAEGWGANEGYAFALAAAATTPGVADGFEAGWAVRTISADTDVNETNFLVNDIPNALPAFTGPPDLLVAFASLPGRTFPLASFAVTVGLLGEAYPGAADGTTSYLVGQPGYLWGLTWSNYLAGRVPAYAVGSLEVARYGPAIDDEGTLYADGFERLWNRDGSDNATNALAYSSYPAYLPDGGGPTPQNKSIQAIAAARGVPQSSLLAASTSALYSGVPAEPFDDWAPGYEWALVGATAAAYNGRYATGYDGFGDPNQAPPPLAPEACTFSGPGIITASLASKLAIGDVVVFLQNGPGTMPTGLNAGASYYVVTVASGLNEIQVSSTPGGAAITPTGGAGEVDVICPALFWYTPLS